MNVRQAKQLARTWVEANTGRWPGLRAAHLVGGITALADEAPFPAAKDVDLHLIFATGSPALEASGPFPNILEVAFGGLSIEAGVKSDAEYASPETVLANPEIAYHLTVDSLIFDPSGWLRAMQEPIRRDYRRRRWVLARLEHQRNGFARALVLLREMGAMWGTPGEVNILGYSTSFFAAALAVATVNPPRMGRRVFMHLRELLAAHGRLDLYEEILALLGVRHVAPERVLQLLREGAEAFDLAVGLRETPHPFLPLEHKLHHHLRPYFVDASLDMIAEGGHREALPWIAAISFAATDLTLLAGPEAVRPRFTARRDALIRELGFDSESARAAKIERVTCLGEQVFALANRIIQAHPGIVD